MSWSVSRLATAGCWLVAALVSALVAVVPRGAALGDEFEGPPIHYGSADADDPVAHLAERIERGEARLEFDEHFGYLPAVLEALGISPSSQGLVFSKTSFQQSRISPRRPRAVYFSDDVYIGWVRGGEVVEVSAVDPRQGAIFYTLDQRRAESPKFVRRGAECLQCHASALTRGIPGHLVRSVFPDPEGHPLLRAGSYVTDHTSPLAERWGGWYVSGTHGEARHLGNATLADDQEPEALDRDAGANVTDLGDRFDASGYLSPHSDIVALLVMEHQTRLHNLITRAAFETRIALYQQDEMNRILERPAEFRSESTERRIAHVADDLLKYLLFAGEAELGGPIRGTTPFAAEFSGRGPRDRQGRSLRELDLERRLFRYPCSYLIYSEAFRELPEAVKDVVLRRLWEVLTGADRSDDFTHLSRDDRHAIREILVETLDDLPDYWKTRRRL